MYNVSGGIPGACLANLTGKIILKDLASHLFPNNTEQVNQLQ